MIKKLKYTTLFLLIIAMILCIKYLWLFDPALGKAYNLLSQQKAVKEFKASDWTILSFSELPQKEQDKYENPSCKKNKFEYKTKKFIKVSWFERYRYVVDKTRINTFITPNRLIGNEIKIPDLAKIQYLLLDEKVMAAYAQLLKECRKKNYDTSKMYITSGFRHPTYNKFVGGAKCSQHQVGTAIDISIGDVNGDGETNQKDKKLINSILERKIIGSKGGLGNYKKHPQLIHFDTRGHRARW